MSPMSREYQAAAARRYVAKAAACRVAGDAKGHAFNLRMAADRRRRAARSQREADIRASFELVRAQYGGARLWEVPA